MRNGNISKFFCVEIFEISLFQITTSVLKETVAMLLNVFRPKPSSMWRECGYLFWAQRAGIGSSSLNHGFIKKWALPNLHKTSPYCDCQKQSCTLCEIRQILTPWISEIFTTSYHRRFFKLLSKTDVTMVFCRSTVRLKFLSIPTAFDIWDGHQDSFYFPNSSCWSL